MNRCLVLFAEGSIEIEFYKQVVSRILEMSAKNKFGSNIKYIDIKSIAGLNHIPFREFIEEMRQTQNEIDEYTVVLCRDANEIQLSSRSTVNWNEIDIEFKEAGIKSLFQIKATNSFEDWLLNDEDGIKTFLQLPKDTQVLGSSGYEKMQNLFKKANKIYYKGMNEFSLIECLDIEKILMRIRDELYPLLIEFDIQF